ncbi:MAG: glycoside hydrolase family 9 protein [Marinilabilia sp.]
MKHLFFLFATLLFCMAGIAQESLTLNEKGYFEMPGLNVTVFADIYPEGHQTGVTIIQHGQRVVANGDVRLEVSPGQWSPIPAAGEETVDEKSETISRHLWFPDSSRNRKGFNPIDYPDLEMEYHVNVTALENNTFKITLDLEEPLPEEWAGKAGFNIELFPEHLFGKSYIMDEKTGHFPRQPNGPVIRDQDHYITESLAKGNHFTMAPEKDLQRISFESEGTLELYDGRANHNNGWYILREKIPADATEKAIEWTVTPNVVPGCPPEPVIHLSQVGYHPKQEKKVVIETHNKTESLHQVRLLKTTADGLEEVDRISPELWGQFLRYNYFTVDISSVRDEGMYVVELDGMRSEPFKISEEVYKRHVWQPVIDYFLPVQMCHMRVEDHYRVWHDACHLDDALMAPTDLNHFDGYVQGESTLTDHDPFDQVAGLDRGGWHDAGDYDIRVESQIGTIELLAMMLEEFDLDYDATSVDREKRLVEIHQADGKNDVVQQIEHGLENVLGAYRSMDRLYRGIICPTLEQYVLLGDGATMTDNRKWDPSMPEEERDDRLVFTEDNPSRECRVGAGLAVAGRVLHEYNPELATECIETALAIWNSSASHLEEDVNKARLAAELFIVTDNSEFEEELIAMKDFLAENASETAWFTGKTLPFLDNADFKETMQEAVQQLSEQTEEESLNSPFGVPYEPHIWGAGWTIQRFGVEQYYLHKAWPEKTSPDMFINALNFMLGLHPGDKAISFASGVGSNSVETAYGVNRADWSFIPGGVVSGTALIRPDLPELKEWPYFWQQTEYVMGGGATNFMFLVLAVDKHLNQ